MSDPDLEKLAIAITTLAARVDAMTWVVGAVAESHPDPQTMVAAWERRHPEAADGGFEATFPHYRECYLKGLQEWTGTLKAIVLRHREMHSGG